MLASMSSSNNHWQKESLKVVDVNAALAILVKKKWRASVRSRVNWLHISQRLHDRIAQILLDPTVRLNPYISTNCCITTKRRRHWSISEPEDEVSIDTITVFAVNSNISSCWYLTLESKDMFNDESWDMGANSPLPNHHIYSWRLRINSSLMPMCLLT